MSEKKDQQDERVITCKLMPGFLPVLVKPHELSKICPWCNRPYREH